MTLPTFIIYIFVLFIWNRNWQFLECLHLPHSEKRKYCHGGFSLYEMRTPVKMV